MNAIYLVTVPIGNHEDITLRALNTLKEMEYIFCEDTRMFKDLCRKIGVDLSDKRINSFHDHSDDGKLNHLLEIAEKNGCAFVSDAGSPVVSDPAFPIITKAISQGIDIKTISGISSVTTALELSGMAPIPFHFHGFLARDKGKQVQDFEVMKSQYGTHIFFEGVSRVKKTLDLLVSEFSNHNIVVARELTKEFESVYRFHASEYESIKNDIVEKGEFVVLVHNPEKEMSSSKALVEISEQILSKGAKPKLVAKLLAEITNKNPKEIYNLISR